MKSSVKAIVQTTLLGGFLLILSVCCWVHSPKAFSDSERRPLATAPDITTDNVISGKFMTEFEKYTLDQFPLRDTFRSIKSLSSFYAFFHLDNNDIYVTDGVIGKMDHPMNTASIDRATDIFRSVYDNFLKGADCTIYTAVIPDKNAFTAADSGHLTYDYDAFYEQYKADMDFAQYVDIAPLLTIEDYYPTDTHWKQECLTDVADTLAHAMGVSLPDDYTTVTTDIPFYGVYYSQAALPLRPDTLSYLTNDIIDSMTMNDFQSEAQTPVYNMDKANGKDPYEMFLSGPLSMITITNPNATSDKELIVFRDSFGSSIAPLLAQGYQTVTLVDVRYLPTTTLLPQYIDFDEQDVLFLYSTMVLNNSETLKQ